MKMRYCQYLPRYVLCEHFSGWKTDDGKGTLIFLTSLWFEQILIFLYQMKREWTKQPEGSSVRTGQQLYANIKEMPVVRIIQGNLSLLSLPCSIVATTLEMADGLYDFWIYNI